MMVSPGGPSLLASFRPGAGCKGSGSQSRGHTIACGVTRNRKGRWYMRAVDNFVAWFKKLFGGRKK